MRLNYQGTSKSLSDFSFGLRPAVCSRSNEVRAESESWYLRLECNSSGVINVTIRLERDWIA